MHPITYLCLIAFHWPRIACGNEIRIPYTLEEGEEEEEACQSLKLRKGNDWRVCVCLYGWIESVVGEGKEVGVGKEGEDRTGERVM